MSIEREKMIESLLLTFVPQIRDMNFKGRFPHFRRTINRKTNLLTIQFDRNGGGFVIVLANCDKPQFKTYWGKIIPIDKLTTLDFHPKNKQLIYPYSLKEQEGTDSCFIFEKAKSDIVYENLAQKVIELIPIMEQYWKKRKIEG